jgi:hypothetical protein
MKIDQYTPRQFAHDIALGYLRQVHNRHTSDLDGLTPAQLREAQAAIARLHDFILDRSGMDGLPLTK